MGLSQGHALSYASTTISPLRSGSAWHGLGEALMDEWDAEQLSSLTLAGALVTAWRSIRNGYSADQAATNSRPTWSATAFNGRSGVTFDGVDDHLTHPATGLFPTGSTPCEIWALIDQTDAPADTTSRGAVSYGGNLSNAQRRVQRVVTAGVNRGQTETGNGSVNVAATNGAVDFNGRVVCRARFGATSSTLEINGVSGNNNAVVPATGTSRFRIGAVANTSPTSFFKGVINYIGVFQPLTPSEAAQMLAFLKARGGIA